MQSDSWQKAEEIRAFLSTGRTITEVAKQLNVSTGAVSMAYRATQRRKKYKLTDWKYQTVCATLIIPEVYFQGFLDVMQITPGLSVREIKNRARTFREDVINKSPLPEPIRTDLDYIVLDGKRFWIVPEKVAEFKELLERD